MICSTARSIRETNRKAMRMPSKEFYAYVNAVNQASLLAQRDFATAWERLDGLDPYAVRDALLTIVPGIARRYGDMVAVAAAEYYGAERVAAGWPDGDHELSDGIPMEQVEASVRYSMGHMFGGDASDGLRPEQDGSLLAGQD